MRKSRLTIFYKDIKMNRYIDTGVDTNAQEFKALEFAVFCIENVAKKLVIGGVANDRVFNTVELYFDGLIDKAEAIKRLMYEETNLQIMFRTEKALSKLVFERSVEV